MFNLFKKPTIKLSQEDDIDALVEMVAENEGYRKLPYIDPLVRVSPETYGIPREHMNIIETYFDKLTITFGFGSTEITAHSAKQALKDDLLNIYIPELKRNKPIIMKIPAKNRNALYDMAYNIGTTKLLGFRRMWLAIENGMLNEAAQEMLDSNYAKQVPNRAKRNSELLQS
jgi:lysozyme